MMYSAKADTSSCFIQLARAGKFNEKHENLLEKCFGQIVQHLKTTHDIGRVVESLPYKSNNFDIVDFTNAMANLGYESKKVKIRASKIDPRIYPCLFIPDKGAPKVVVQKHRDGRISVYDSASDSIITADRNNNLSGHAYIFRHMASSAHKGEVALRKSIGEGWFRSNLARFRSLFIHVFVLSIVLNFISLATPLFIMAVYDHVVAARMVDKLDMLVIGVGLAISAELFLRALRNKSLSWFSGRIDYIVGNAIFGKLLHLPAALIEHGSVAAQISRLKAFESVRDFFSGPLFLVLLELPFTLIILATIAIIGGWLAIIPAITAFAYLVLIALFRQRMKLAIHLSAKAVSAKQQNYIETFEKLHSLKTNGLHEVWNDKFRDISGKASLYAFKSSMLASTVEVLSHAFALLAGLAIIYFGVEKVISAEMSAGALVAIMILVWRILSPLQILCGALPRMEQLKQSLQQVNRLMDIESEKSAEQSLRQNSLVGNITLNKVGLRYSRDADPVFAGLSFQVREGQLVAIAGSNGMGKSTILKLINGLYRPQAGSVRIDGVDIRQINPVELRRQVAYVSQTPEFFRGTLAENMRYAAPMASDEEIRAALRQVDALAEVEAMKSGINTMLGRGLYERLPSSLAYRLNLARAYLKDAPILLIDELPYELLASRTGEIFKQALMRWKGNKTVIIVTHRNDFITMADMAVLLRGNEPSLVGNPSQILNIIKDNKEFNNANTN